MTGLMLEHANLPGCAPEVLIELAGEAGFEAVSLRVQPFSRGEQVWLPQGAADLSRLHDLLDRAGITIAAVDVFPLRPRLDVEKYRDAFAFTQQIGARHALATCATPEPDLLLQQAVECANLAAEYDVSVNLEFTVMGSLPSLNDAVALLRKADHPNLGITLDALHWARAGSTIQDVREAGSLIRHVQLCDAPLVNPWQSLMEEAMIGRLLPGEGELPLVELLSAVPDGALLGLEMCGDEILPDQQTDWVERMARTSRQVLNEAGRG